MSCKLPSTLTRGRDETRDACAHTEQKIERSRLASQLAFVFIMSRESVRHLNQTAFRNLKPSYKLDQKAITQVNSEVVRFMLLLARLEEAVHVAVAVAAQHRAVHRHRVPAHTHTLQRVFQRHALFVILSQNVLLLFTVSTFIKDFDCYISIIFK